MTHRRRALKPRTSAAIAAGVVGIASVASITVLNQTAFAEARVADRGELCAAFERFAQALDTSQLRNQVALRRLAADLSATAARFPVLEQVNSRPAREASVSIETVLAAPAPTVLDLWVAARPVAVECGYPWPNARTNIAGGDRPID